MRTSAIWQASTNVPVDTILPAHTPKSRLCWRSTWWKNALTSCALQAGGLSAWLTDLNCWVFPRNWLSFTKKSPSTSCRMVQMLRQKQKSMLPSSRLITNSDSRVKLTRMEFSLDGALRLLSVTMTFNLMKASLCRVNSRGLDVPSCLTKSLKRVKWIMASFKMALWTESEPVILLRLAPTQVSSKTVELKGLEETSI